MLQWVYLTLKTWHSFDKMLIAAEGFMKPNICRIPVTKGKE